MTTETIEHTQNPLHSKDIKNLIIEQLDNQLDKPWHLLSDDIKLWIKNNGFLIKEYSTVSAIVFPEWKAAYIKAKILKMNGNE